MAVNKKILEFFGVDVTYDKMGQYIWAVEKNGNHQKIADLRGWGAIQNLFKDKKGAVDFPAAGALQDELGQFFVDAIKEKLERERKQI